VPDLWRYHRLFLIVQIRQPKIEALLGKKPLLLGWSSGKDSALALEKILASKLYDVTLLTTVTEGYERISMHGVREDLLRMQAQSLGLPIDIVYIPQQCSDEEYRCRMEAALLPHHDRGCRGMVFGDIFLQSIREYREENLAKVGMKPVFPLWQRDSRELSQEFMDSGFKAIVTCVDTEALDRSFTGRVYDKTFVEDLPPDADPCGENGEFHSFVFDGPIFSQPVPIRRGETVLRDERFCFCDLLPEETDK
jgi:uncharacterized protein (TIGR00290 family)